MTEHYSNITRMHGFLYPHGDVGRQDAPRDASEPARHSGVDLRAGQLVDERTNQEQGLGLRQGGRKKQKNNENLILTKLKKKVTIVVN